jgi:hypothetical protein
LRLAAQAHCTSVVFSQGSPLRSRAALRLPALLAANLDAHAADNRRLVNIETGDAFMHNFHRISSTSMPPAWGPKVERSLGSVLRGIAAPGCAHRLIATTDSD